MCDAAWFRWMLLMAGLSAGCVLPTRDGTGLELSWRFVESNTDDGDGARRVRSCSGALTERLDVRITDEADEDRTRTFPFACMDGFQTAAELHTQPSDVFVELRSGTYALATAVRGPGGKVVLKDEQSVEVGKRGVTLQTWDFQVPTSTMTLELAGRETCTQLAMSMEMDDPESALPELELGDEEEQPTIVYRQNLRSDGGLSLSGAPMACAALTESTHRFTDLDRGRYRLLVTVDTRMCPLLVAIDRPDVSLDIDLADLPCSG